MLDDDDIEIFIWAVNPQTVVGLVIAMVVIIGLYYAVSENHKECDTVKCQNGTVPMLTNNECLCVAKPMVK